MEMDYYLTIKWTHYWYMQQHGGISKICRMKEARHLVHMVWFHLYDVQNQVKLLYDNENQHSGFSLRVEGSNWGKREGNFLGS